MSTENLTVRASMRDELSAPARKVQAEVRGIAREVHKADRAGGRFGRTLTRVGGGATRVGSVLRGGLVRGLQAVTIAAGLAGAGLLIIGKNSLQAAADADETQSKFDTVFGSLRGQVSNTVDYWHERFGIATADLQNATSMFAIFGKSAGITGQPLASFSTNLTQAGLDLASFYNVASDGADGTFAAIRSGLAGETEPLRRFGIFLNDAAVTAKASTMGLTGALTDQQKVAVRQQLILEQLGDANGDLERTQFSAANQARKLSGYWDDFQVTLGRLFLPAATSVVRLLNDKLGPITLRLSRNVGRLTAAFKAGDWADFATIVDRVAGANGNLAPKILGVIRFIKQMHRIIVNSVIPALTAVAGVAADILAPSIDLLVDGFQWLSRHAEVAKPIFIGIAAVLAGLVLFTSPILAVVAGIILLVAAGTRLYERFQVVRDVVEAVGRFFGDLADRAGELIGSLDFSKIGDTLGPLMDAVTELGDAMGGWHRVLPIVAGIAGALLLLAGGPVTAIAGLAAGLVFLYTRFEPVRNVVDALVRFFVERWIPAMLAVDRVIVGVLAAGIRHMVRGWTLVIRVLRRVWSATTPLRAAFAAVARFLRRVASVSLKGLIAGIRSAWRFTAPLRGVVAGVVRIFGRLAALRLAVVIGAVLALVGAVRALWNRSRPVRTVLAAIGRLGLGVVKAAVGALVDLVQALWEKARPVRDLISTIGGLGLGVLKSAVDGVHSAFEAMRDAVQWLLDKIPTISFPSAPSWLPSALGGDTATPHTRPGRSLAEAYHRANYAAGMTPGPTRVLSAYRPGGSGDHSRGAVDFGGSNLPTMAGHVRAMGGFAELHGEGTNRHLHVAPGGDTARPHIRPSTAPRHRRGGGGGNTVVLEHGAVLVYEPAGDVDVEKAVRKAVKKALHDAEERD